MKTIKSILYSIYARILWALVGCVACATLVEWLGETNADWRRYIVTSWKK
jgi:hypothetical protein